MSYLLMWCGVVTGGVLVLSAAAKFADPGGFRVAVRGFRVLPAAAEAPVAAVVPVLEAAVPVLLLVPPTRPAGFLLAAVLLLGFVAGMVTVLRRRLTTRCACFGSGSSSVIAWRHVWRNVALLAVCAAGTVAALADPGRPATAGLLIAALAALPAIAAVRFLDDLAFLFGAPTPTPPVRRSP